MRWERIITEAEDSVQIYNHIHLGANTRHEQTKVHKNS